MLKLRNSATSPYVRKVRVLLLEIGLEDRVELIDTQVTPTNPNAELNVDNPIGKVPVLLTENGMALYDSPVICEYLDSLHSGTKMFPVNSVSRWLALPPSGSWRWLAGCSHLGTLRIHPETGGQTMAGLA